ncbi:MAG: hypothetical protein FJY10_05980 [Bacteroidetes bacterium]|nr:hypothetical protein [Bacteroidota bacterium]
MRQLFIIILVLFSLSGISQEVAETDTLPDEVLLRHQYSLGVQAHTGGWGLKVRWGKNLRARKQRMFEIDLVTQKSQKEIRVINPYFPNAKSYFYGRLNYIYFLRGGIGFHHILNQKPYWGGVQLSAFYYGGLTLGMAKPVYLYILYFSQGYDEYDIKEEKYDPDVHYIDNIYGRGSWTSGIGKTRFYPGLYARTGLDFEFGTKHRLMQALEVGGTMEYFPLAIPMMAFNPKKSLFVSLYLSFSIGKRYNK